MTFARFADAAADFAWPNEPRLRDVLEFYLADPTCRHSPENIAGYRRAVALVEQAFGPDAPLKRLDRAACRRFLALLRLTPAQFARRRPGMSLDDAAAMTVAGAGGPLMQVSTLNTHLSKLRSLLDIACAEGLIDRNPALGLSLPDPIPPGDHRQPFSLGQLKAMFSAPLYTGCGDDRHRFARQGPGHPRRARFWAPLIALHSGLRLNEILQLDVADVRQVQGVACFVITRASAHGGTDKRVKTPNGERLVPVHPALKRFGFLDYVSAQAAAGKVKLFPECRLAPSCGLYSAHFSKGFRRFLKAAGAEAPRTSFHSFRHNFRDALRDGGVDLELALALGGWAGSSCPATRGGSSYGAGYSPARLARAVARVRYPGLDLSHLPAA